MFTALSPKLARDSPNTPRTAQTASGTVDLAQGLREIAPGTVNYPHEAGQSSQGTLKFLRGRFRLLMGSKKLLMGRSTSSGTGQSSPGRVKHARGPRQPGASVFKAFSI